MKWEFHPQAREELDQSADWYELQKSGLGLRFLDEVEEVIGKILKTPEKWRKVYADVRRCLMDKFPFTIFYRIRGTLIEILAVSHHGRRPGYWKPRL